MAQEFPVVLEKDGIKRTAHTVIAYNQLKTQGFTEAGSKPKRQPRKAADDKPKTEAKPVKAEAEEKSESK